MLRRESTEEAWGLEIGKSKDGLFIQSIVSAPLMGFSGMRVQRHKPHKLIKSGKIREHCQKTPLSHHFGIFWIVLAILFETRALSHMF